jgi:hypothetical protein
VDTSRLAREVGFTPRFTTVAAVEDWVAARAGAGAARGGAAAVAA